MAAYTCPVIAIPPRSVCLKEVALKGHADANICLSSLLLALSSASISHAA